MASALGSFFTALVNFDFPPLPQPQIATRIAPAWNCLIKGTTWKKPGRTKAKTRVQKTFQPSRLEVLPQVLLCEVLNLLDHRDQKSLRLLNRCLEQIASPHLFRHIHLSPSLGSYQRLRALSRQPRLNKLVKHVTFHTNTYPKELSLQDFKSSLTRSIFCPTQEELPYISWGALYIKYQDFDRQHTRFCGLEDPSVQLAYPFSLLSNLQNITACFDFYCPDDSHGGHSMSKAADIYSRGCLIPPTTGYTKALAYGLALLLAAKKARRNIRSFHAINLGGGLPAITMPFHTRLQPCLEDLPQIVQCRRCTFLPVSRRSPLRPAQEIAHCIR